MPVVVEKEVIVERIVVATPTPRPTPLPSQVVSARDTVRIITNAEPNALGFATGLCSHSIQDTVCDDMVGEPLTWIDDTSFEVVPLSPIESWEQLEPDRWRFQLRDGVTFHNGAEWNAEQAKFWIDFGGDEETGGNFNANGFAFHGVQSGEVVDRLTLDIVCGEPALPHPAPHHDLHQVPGRGLVPTGH